VWVADLLRAALADGERPGSVPWVVGGDFNLSETFDLWRGGPRGNREYLDLMARLGFVECLRMAQGRLTPTFRNTDGTTVKHQMDHLFVSQSLARHLRACDVGSHDEVFGQNLSEHLPIVADFDMTGAAGA
jgi:endonuclease/exonuclease/phosphatase family metal-dependent hydrolase